MEMLQYTDAATGRVYSGETPEQVVQSMRLHAWHPGDSEAEYMQAVSVAVYSETGKEVRGEDAAEFVSDLVKAGALIVGAKQVATDAKPEECDI